MNKKLLYPHSELLNEVNRSIGKLANSNSVNYKLRLKQTLFDSCMCYKGYISALWLEGIIDFEVREKAMTDYYLIKSIIIEA